MGLRTKLFLWIGSLIFLLALLMFIFPKYFIEKDIAQATANVRNLIQQETLEIEANQKNLLQEKVNEILRDVNAILFLINEFQGIPSSSGLENLSLWKKAARLLTYNPDVGFVQIHDEKNQNVAAIVSYGVPIYTAKTKPLKEEFVTITLHSLEEPKASPITYLGIPLKKDSSNKTFFYALIDVHEAAQEMETILQKAKGEEFLLKEYSPEALKEFSFDTSYLLSEEYWANEIELINLLAPIYGEGIQVLKQSPPRIPNGIVHVNEKGEGFGILSTDVFRSQLVFEDAKYFSSHNPTNEGPPIAKGSTAIFDEGSGLLFLGNTLYSGGIYITLGSSFDQTARQLALASNRGILFSYQNNYWKGFTAKGEKISENELIPLYGQKDLASQDGLLKLGNFSYHYSRVTPLPGQPVVFYVLTPLEKEKSILTTLHRLDKDLTAKISSQILIMMILAVLVSLIILARIALKITQPIIKLARATEEVSNGKYESIDLPDVGNRKDEIAVLSKSFGEMVHGLEEREKIRGVLNKVVSKDVADEILKTNIHLGGEDRIVTILFSDIRGFTKLTENLTPQQTITMLNKYMTKMSRVIEGEGGVIDKYVGDEIMALYGAPTPHPDHAIRALSAAKLMAETLKKWNEERVSEHLPKIESGIGIHTGLVVAGNMGAEDRLNYTVLGANVNLAARLCQVAKPMQIIISQHTLEEPGVRDSFEVRSLDPILLKGFSEPVKIYEITGFKWT